MKKKLSVEVLREAEIEPAYWRLDVNTFPGSSESLEVCRQYMKGPLGKKGVGLIFCALQADQGSCGKTFLLSALVKEYLVRGYPAKYASLERITDLVFENNHSFLLQLLKQYPIWALDDVNELTHRAKLKVLHLFLTTRAQQGVPSFIATSLTREEVQGQVSQATWKLWQRKYLWVPCPPFAPEFIEAEMRANQQALCAYAH